jgi:UDP-N-acetyl-D-glucosamine/UDP-N-acetyl-D-galactosamine dehydrogenase
MQSMFELLETPEAVKHPTLVDGPVSGPEPGQETVAVVGLGYVGIPVAVAFGRKRPTIGYDRVARKVESLRSLVDPTGELSTEELRQARQLRATVDATDLERAEYVIVAVPTPVNAARQPDFEPLESASYTVGKYLRSGATVIYESTVYPGATEEICVPILERASGMRWRQDFHVGYSPERINPGDRDHCFNRIVKVVAGDDAETLEKVAALYASVVDAGVYRAPSIRVAEAAKVIENTQRDLNIAFVNELSIIFDKLGIDTAQVLDAASSKWNFLPFRPGLVGGHCIGVDPYYLTHKAEAVGYHPQMILAGRRINDGMGAYIARKIVQQMIHAGRNVRGARVVILGATFKEDVPDIRNSKVIDVIRELRDFGVDVQVHDPVADPGDVLAEYDLRLRNWEDLSPADALVLAVPHKRFRELPAPAYLQKIVKHGCFIDLKAVFDPESFRREGVRVWRL